MSSLNIERKSVYEVFTKRGLKFLIPDYQRPYSWTLDHCETLWEDFKEFAFPNGDAEIFNDDKDEYFLGTILTFDNGCGQNEVIDGQQRLITLLLLLRAFYESFGESKNKTYGRIAECIWKIDRNDNPDFSTCKITSEVATDENNKEFGKIISEGIATQNDKSNYAENYRYFQRKINEFKLTMPDNFSLLPKRILDNCILLPIETNSQNTALRIFTTLNDRGMPLSDSDIFKAQFYKFFQRQGKSEKENFVNRWRELERLCNKNFHPRTGTSMDDLFMRYMYYLMARENIKSDTFLGLRPYYEKNNYAILQDEKTFEDLEILAKFWDDVANRYSERFSERILRQLYILSYSPYNIWAYIVSLYFMSNRNDKNSLSDENFYNFLDKINAMILMHGVANLGVQSIRRPFFVEFGNILRGENLSFKDYRQDKKSFIEKMREMSFSNTRRITRAILAWWIFRNSAQELPPIDTRLEIEHIYAVKRHEFSPLSDEKNLELLGNKALLEKRINIRAADYRFEDKKKYYLGYKRNGKWTQGTMINELRELAETKEDFTEEDILTRNEKIFSAFIEYLEQNNLLR
ncbi:MAG: DUF262 domain-containing protein [Selenomonadaceae bacterium]|nr:DUF262 domain-containing protein [Selenomonadaceae bacterium]